MPTKKSLTSFFKRLFFTVKVEGESAWPELVPGKRYYATGLGRAAVGDFLIFKNPREPSGIAVKKVESKTGNRYWVKGSLSWATSSREWGPIDSSLVIGKIIKP